MIRPIAILSTIALLASCGKETINPGKPAPSSDSYSSARKYADFSYTLVKDPISGDYSCPTPKVDCSKVSPPPTGTCDPLDEAIATNSVQEFFNSSGWEEVFPYLDGVPAVVAGLKNGTYTMVKRENNGNTFYIVVNNIDLPESFQMDQVIYSTMFDHTL